MPTPAGKPKVGERVRIHVVLPGDKNPIEPRYGTVTRRGNGFSWCLWVKWDYRGRAAPPAILTEAGWYMDKGYLTIVERGG